MAATTALPLPRRTADRAVPAGRTVWTARRGTLFRLALGTGLLAAQVAFVAGAAWDIQWHFSVGRDRPFTPPHLLLLAGIALSGSLALLGVILWSLAVARGRRRPAATRTVAAPVAGGARPAAPLHRTTSATGAHAPGTVGIAGIFHAPLGAYLAGFGALCAAVAFPLDDYWHRLHGLDVTIWAPFHVMIVSGMALAALGPAYLFAAAANVAAFPRDTAPSSAAGAPSDPATVSPAAHRSATWGRIAAGVGTALALAGFAATLLVLLAQALDDEGILAVRPRPVIVYPALLALLVIPALVAAAPAVRLPGGATLVALMLTLFRLGLLAFVPAAVHWAAALEGQIVRRTSLNAAVTPFAFPAWILFAGLLVDAAWWLSRRYPRRLPPGPVLLAAGIAAALLEALIERPWAESLPLTRLGRGMDVPAALGAALPAVALCGLLAAAIGVGLGAALRRTQV